MIRRASPYVLLGMLVALALVPLLGSSPAYAARTITISLTADGPKPASTTAAVGDTIQFRNDDATFVHQVGSGSGPWTAQWQSPPLAPGQQYAAPKLAKPGTYVYQGVNLDDFTGKVVVPGTAGPTPAKTATARPAASKSAAALQTPTASPSPTGGAGDVGPPPLAGVVISPPPAPGAGVPKPNVAPTLAGEEIPSAEPSGPTIAVGRGRLPEPPTARKYGLPAALAAVGIAGVASLLVRLLLAHPAARRAKHAAGRGDLTVTVE